jgi:hypothetical protein
MTTRINVSRAHRVQSALWIVVMLLVSGVVSGRTIQASRCPDRGAEPKGTVSVQTSLSAAAQAAPGDRMLPATLFASTGVDLEVRIWNVRIGFPWLKSLPVTPGRRIVVSLWEADPDR